MISFEQAKQIGIQACIDKIGRELVQAHKDTTCFASGNVGDHMFCFVGVNTKPDPDPVGRPLVLDGEDEESLRFEFLANCLVSYEDGEVRFLKCILPE